jgi:hypothetical protein
MIIKGVPPLIVDLKEFYKIPEKVAIIEEMLLRNIDSMNASYTLIGDEEE